MWWCVKKILESINGAHGVFVESYQIFLPNLFLTQKTCLQTPLQSKRESRTILPAARLLVVMRTRSPPLPAATPTTSHRSSVRCRRSVDASAPMKSSPAKPGICPTSSELYILFFVKIYVDNSQFFIFSLTRFVRKHTFL